MKESGSAGAKRKKPPPQSVVKRGIYFWDVIEILKHEPQIKGRNLLKLSSKFVMCFFQAACSGSCPPPPCRRLLVFSLQERHPVSQPASVIPGRERGTKKHGNLLLSFILINCSSYSCLITNHFVLLLHSRQTYCFTSCKSSPEIRLDLSQTTNFRRH